MCAHEIINHHAFQVKVVSALKEAFEVQHKTDNIISLCFKLSFKVPSVGKIANVKLNG